MCVEATGTLVFYFNRDEGLYALFLNLSETSSFALFFPYWLICSLAPLGQEG